ncbi:MAG: hypothetical protein ACRENI_00210 [Gemmatimonadaceae bacterium]
MPLSITDSDEMHPLSVLDVSSSHRVGMGTAIFSMAGGELADQTRITANPALLR